MLHLLAFQLNLTTFPTSWIVCISGIFQTLPRDRLHDFRCSLCIHTSVISLPPLNNTQTHTDAHTRTHTHLSSNPTSWLVASILASWYSYFYNALTSTMQILHKTIISFCITVKNLCFYLHNLWKQHFWYTGTTILFTS